MASALEKTKKIRCGVFVEVVTTSTSSTPVPSITAFTDNNFVDDNNHVESFK